MSNLSRFNTKSAANEGRWMTVQDPENKGTPLLNGDKPIRIHLLGRDADVFIKQRNMNRADEMRDVRKNVGFSQAVIDDRNFKLLAAATKGWENMPTSWVKDSDSDEPIEFSPDNAYALYSRIQWLFDDVDEFVGERKNYFEVSKNA